MPTRLSALVFVVGVLTARPAEADLYTSEQDGVIHITTEKPRQGRVLYRVRDDARTRQTAGTGSSGAGGEGAGPRAGGRNVPATFAPIVRRAAQYYDLPEALLWAVMRIESGFNPRAVSRVGAQGLLQLMPGTAREMGVDDAFDPEQNIFGGARYLRLLANRFSGDLVLTLSGYHAGGGAVDQVGGIPYTQTAEYVRRVLNAYYAFQREPPVPAATPESP